MFQPLIRFGKRTIVLIPGLVLTYVAVKDIYPVIERRVPDFIAVFVTYVLTAYLLIPASIRLFRILIKPKHIPLYSTTPDGFACDPVNIGLVGTRDEIIAAMTAAGWYVADRRTWRNVVKMGVAIFLRIPYPTAPFSNLYLLGRKQDIGFELPVELSPNHRHHVRFWALTYTVDQRYVDHLYFWQQKYHSETPDRILWVGAASQDIGIRFIRHNAQITHMIHPDTNAERTLIVDGLHKAGVITKQHTIKAGSPYKLRNRVLGGYMIADGDLIICDTKSYSLQPNS